MNVGNEFRIAALKRDLSDIHNSMSEISSLATLTQPTAISDELNLSPSPSICQLQKRLAQLGRLYLVIITLAFMQYWCFVGFARRWKISWTMTKDQWLHFPMKPAMERN